MTAIQFATREIETPLGRFEIAATSGGLTHCQLVGYRRLPTADGSAAELKQHLAAGEAALGRYFAGEKDPWDELVLAPAGTEFQLRVWAALRRIPYGTTLSYLELARSAGSPKGARAVGQANHNNPLGIIVPCHRVIAADGTLGGYAGGLERKRWLLEHEGALPRSERQETAARLRGAAVRGGNALHSSPSVRDPAEGHESA